MILLLTASQAIEWTMQLLAVYVLIDSAEKIYCFKEYRETGLYNWEVLNKNKFFFSLPNPIRKISDHLYSFRVWMSLLGLRFFGGFMILVPHHCELNIIGLSAIFIIGSLMNFRDIPYGAETANRLALVITGGLLLRSIMPTPIITLTCFWFIGLQSCLSYLTAGVSKLFNSEWRNGNGLMHVINSSNLIPEGKVTSFFIRHTNLVKYLTWTTLLVECLFPLVIFVNPPFFWIFLIWGILFHLTVAIWLRLGKFFWIWMATYPAIIFITQR